MEELSIPEGLDLVANPPEMTIRRKWRTWKIIPAAIFAVVWDGFMIGFYALAFSKPHPHLGFLLFPLGHVAIGVGLTYFVFATLLNTTDVSVSSGVVQVATVPVPWFGNKRISSSEIRDVKVRQRTGSKGSLSYAVVYVDLAGNENSLGPALSESDQAEYISAKLRQQLRLGR